ncbi:MAG: 30S ribosomal protein S17 [Longimicrobiales bacterium]
MARKKAQKRAPKAEQERAQPAEPEQAGQEREARARRKIRVGRVVSDRMQKTVVVAIDRRVTHAVYGKQIVRTTKLHAHDESGEAKVGDKVRIMETRPVSKTKRWRLLEILEKAK